jgi:hypothetical protein
MALVATSAYESPVFVSDPRRVADVAQSSCPRQHTRSRGAEHLGRVYAVLGGGYTQAPTNTHNTAAGLNGRVLPANNHVYASLATQQGGSRGPKLRAASSDEGGIAHTTAGEQRERSLSAPPPPPFHAAQPATSAPQRYTDSSNDGHGSSSSDNDTEYDDEYDDDDDDGYDRCDNLMRDSRAFPTPPPTRVANTATNTAITRRRSPADPLPSLPPRVDPIDADPLPRAARAMGVAEAASAGDESPITPATPFYGPWGRPTASSVRSRTANNSNAGPTLGQRQLATVDVGAARAPARAFEQCEWFHGPIDRVEAESRLSRAGHERAGRLGSGRGCNLRPYAEGMFLVRSRPQDDDCVLSVMAAADCPSGLRVWHFRVSPCPRGGGITVDTQDGRV